MRSPPGEDRALPRTTKQRSATRRTRERLGTVQVDVDLNPGEYCGEWMHLQPASNDRIGDPSDRNLSRARVTAESNETPPRIPCTISRRCSTILSAARSFSTHSSLDILAQQEAYT